MPFKQNSHPQIDVDRQAEGIPVGEIKKDEQENVGIKGESEVDKALDVALKKLFLPAIRLRLMPCPTQQDPSGKSHSNNTGRKQPKK